MQITEKHPALTGQSGFEILLWRVRINIFSELITPGFEAAGISYIGQGNLGRQ